MFEMKKCITLFCVSIVLLSAGCNQATQPSSKGNLIYNPLFNNNGAPSFDGWLELTGSNGIDLSTEIPPGGSIYTLTISSAGSTLSSEAVPIALANGAHRYEISVWGKVAGNGGADSGIAMLVSQAPAPSGTGVMEPGFVFSTPQWTLFSRIDTIDGGNRGTQKLYIGFSIKVADAAKVYFANPSIIRLD